jgi:hypothetical protein
MLFTPPIWESQLFPSTESPRLCYSESVSFDASTCKINNLSCKLIGVIPGSTNGLYKVGHVYAATVSPERVNLPTLHTRRRLAHIAPTLSVRSSEKAQWRAYSSSATERLCSVTHAMSARIASGDNAGIARGCEHRVECKI